VRRRRRLPPEVRPREGRKLPRELRPDRVARAASRLPGGLEDPGFADLLHRIDQGPILGGNRVRLFTHGEDAFAAMRRAISEAKTEVLIESYILKDDATGQTFAADLGDAAERGVSVKVLADFFGSYATHARFWKELRRRGVDARLFNPIFPQLWLQPFRDHRKILVVDRRVGFTGGMNIADEYGSARGGSHRGPWRDTQVRVEGPTAWEMAVVFSEAWRRAGGRLALEPLERPGDEPSRILTLDSRPGRGHGETASVLVAVTAAARRRMWITNAYFAPDFRALGHLGRAAARGVDVRLLLPGKTDVRLVRHAGHGYFRRLLDFGVRIFEYQGAVLHAKTAVADDFISIAGSTNLDFRSFHFNAECNLVVFCPEVGAAFSRAFEEDLDRSREIRLPAWRRRPRLHAFADSSARLLAPLL
jgi:cardiolipin synthase